MSKPSPLPSLPQMSKLPPELAPEVVLPAPTEDPPPMEMPKPGPEPLPPLLKTLASRLRGWETSFSFGSHDAKAV